MIDGDGVVDGLQEARLVGEVLGPEHLQPDQAGAGGDALDADPARPGQWVVREVADVVGLAALRGDRAGVDEGLAAGRRRVQAVTGEVLVVDEHVAAVGPDEVGVVDVDALGHERDLDPGAGEAEGAGGLGARDRAVAVGQRECLRGQLRCRTGGRTECLAAGSGGGGRGGRFRARLVDDRRVDHRVGDDLGHRGIGPQRLLRGGADRRRQRVHRREGVDLARSGRPQRVDDRRLGGLHAPPARADRRDAGRQAGQLVAEHDDDALVGPAPRQREGGRRGGRSPRCEEARGQGDQGCHDSCDTDAETRWHADSRAGGSSGRSGQPKPGTPPGASSVTVSTRRVSTATRRGLTIALRRGACRRSRVDDEVARRRSAEEAIRGLER